MAVLHKWMNDWKGRHHDGQGGSYPAGEDDALRWARKDVAAANEEAEMHKGEEEKRALVLIQARRRLPHMVRVCYPLPRGKNIWMIQGLIFFCLYVLLLG